MSDNATHSRFGGSVINRVIACPGSVALCATVPKRPSSTWADEGTWAHALAAYCLEQGYTDAESFRHTSLPLGVEVPEQYSGAPCGPVVDAVNVYLKAVHDELALSDDAELYVEQAFELKLATAEPGEVFGRNDAVVYHPGLKRVRVFDYKHGAGVAVEVVESAQLKFYLAGALLGNSHWRVADVRLTIVQPRALDMDDRGPVKDWDMDPTDVFEFLSEVEDAVAKAKFHEATFHEVVRVEDRYQTGDHCRWCDAAAVCPAREFAALKAAQVDFADVTVVTPRDLPDPKDLDLERLSKVVAGIGILQDWANQCREFLEGLVLSGQEVPGWKAVEKLGRAKWIDDPNKIAAEAAMLYDIDTEQMLPPKLVTITEAEKLLKAAGATKDQVDDFKLKFTIKESSGLTVAPESDRRPAVNAAARDFADVKI